MEYQKTSNHLFTNNNSQTIFLTKRGLVDNLQSCDYIIGLAGKSELESKYTYTAHTGHKFNFKNLVSNDKYIYHFESNKTAVRYKKDSNYENTRTHNVVLCNNEIFIENNNSQQAYYKFDNNESALIFFNALTRG